MGETIHASGSTCAWLSVSHFGCAVTERADGEREEPVDGEGREMCPRVPRLPTEVQDSEVWRESKHWAKSGEKSSLSGM